MFGTSLSWCYNNAIKLERGIFVFDNIVVQIVVAVLILGYVGYTTFKSIKLYTEYKKNLPNFLNTHKDAKLFTDNPIWWIGTSVLAVFAFVMIFVTGQLETEQVFYFRLAYLAIAVIFVGLALETYVRKRVYLIDEGIYYIGKIYRFRMMANFEVRSGIVQNIRILMNDKEKLEVSKKMGVYINDAYDEWKKQRKGKRK